MITLDKLSAIVQYKNNAKSQNFVKRLVARANALQYQLLDKDNNLKPEYDRLVNAVVSLTNQGASLDDSIAVAMNEFNEPKKTAHDYYNELKR